jgi:pilus assembly protein CpaE
MTKKHSRGEMIVVCSSKGGIGRTVIAVNLAVSLSKKNIKIAVLDGNFQFGDVSLALDLHSSFTIKDVASDIDRLDEYTLSSYMSHHESGVKVLSAPDRPEYAELITSEVLRKVMDFMLELYDYVIVDTGAGLNDTNLHLIERADQILMLTNLEMATLKNTKLMLETLDTLDMIDKVQLIVNRSTMESVIQAGDVPGILGVEAPLYIPNDFSIVSQSLNIGIPFVMSQGKSELSKSIFKMAERLSSGRELRLIKPKSPSFLQSIFQKTKLKEGTE